MGNLYPNDADGVKYRTVPLKNWQALWADGHNSHRCRRGLRGCGYFWGGEGWAVWVLAWLGHQGPVHAFDGGISLWQATGYPVVKIGHADFPEETYSIHLQPDLNISAEDIADAEDTFTLVDTRKYLTEYLPGHIPGAVHIPWEKFHRGDHRQFISADALKRLFTDKGVDVSKPVVYYCTGGIRSGFTWMVHELAGLGQAKILKVVLKSGIIFNRQGHLRNKGGKKICESGHFVRSICNTMWINILFPAVPVACSMRHDGGFVGSATVPTGRILSKRITTFYNLMACECLRKIALCGTVADSARQLQWP
ncbi:MAG: rhodanese-like domain-containing protein [Desulfobacterales bacterium]